MTSALKFALAAFLAAFASCVLANDYAGTVKTTRGDVAVERGGTRSVLAPGTPVRQGDRITTGNTGYVGITMRDDTLITLGPGGVLVLDAYGFDPKTHDGRFKASLTRGVLSVVTGLIARRSPESFAVTTRVATMGVRGTEFIVEANDQ